MIENLAYERKLCDLELELTAVKLRNEELLDHLSEARKSRETLAGVFDKLPAACLVLEASGTVLDANAAARALLQLEKGKSFKESMVRFIPKGEIAPFLKHLRDCKIRGTTVSTSLRLRTAHGTFFQASLTTSLLGFNRSERGCFSMVITDESGRQREFEQRERNTQEFIDSLGAVVWEADAHTLRRTYVSKQAERLLGYPLHDWLSEPDFWQNHIFIDDRERVLDLTYRAVATRQNFICEYRFIGPDRRQIWLRDFVNLLGEGEQLRLRGITIDVSAAKQAQVELQQARTTLEQRVAERTDELQTTVRELESFSYTLSHDMRAPLRTMHGFTELLMDQCAHKLTTGEQEYLQRIQTSAMRLDSMIQDVLKYSKVGKAPIEARSVNVDKLIREVIREYPNFQPKNAEIEIESPLLPVLGHEGFLTQCVSNLLSNAIKFVPPQTKPRVRIYTKPIGEAVQLCFEDNGIGIAPQDQRRIFRIFQRLNPADRFDGTGLGLAIVQRAAERMGGRAGVDSAVGRGSRFWLQLQRP